MTQLKYADQAHLAKSFGAWLATAGAELIASSEVVVPVPLHYWRFVGRRYNQSALLAYALARHCPLPVLPRRPYAHPPHQAAGLAFPRTAAG